MLNKILGIAECRSRIHRIQRLGNVLQDSIHAVAVGTLDHARQHGDVTVACELLNALPNGQRVKALAAWYRHFSGKSMSLSQTTEGMWKGKMAAGWTPDKFDVKAAMATTFADLTTEKAPDKLIDLAVIRKMLAKVVNDDTLLPNGSKKVTDKARTVATELVQIVDKSITATA